MHETSKAVMRRLHDARFVSRYFVGTGIDIGAGPDPIGQYRELFPRMRACRAWDLADGDAQLLATLPDASLDFVHSSHCLEHMRDPAEALHHWLRVLKPGGHLVVLVPDEDLYEQGIFPSTFNPDHKWSFTTCKSGSWSPRSVNVTELLARFAGEAHLLKLETLDATFRKRLADRFDQTRTPIAECALEFVLRRSEAPMGTYDPSRGMARAPAPTPALPARADRAVDVRQLPYATVRPIANYAPWAGDREFAAVVEQVKGSTLVDVLRLWELWTLVEETRALPGSILEVGVWRGGTGAVMAKRLAMLGDTANLVLCDTFAGVVKAGEADLHYQGGEHGNATEAGVRQLLAAVAPREETHVLRGVFPDQTGDRLKHLQFRMVHIDVDVYESARDILEFVWPRMAPGGVVVYDDYGFHTCTGITRLVEEQRGLPDRLVVHNLNGHAIVVKR